MNEVMFDTIVELVKREVKGLATEEECQYLRERVGLTAWREALAAAINDISEQFSYKKESLALLAHKFEIGLISRDEYNQQSEWIEEWRRKANRYKMGLENRLHEIKAMERENNVRATEYKYKFEEMVKAVTAHKIKKGKASVVDKELWETVDRLVSK